MVIARRRLLLVQSTTAPTEPSGADWFRRADTRALCFSCLARWTRGLYCVDDMGRYSESPLCWRCWTEGTRLMLRPLGEVG